MAEEKKEVVRKQVGVIVFGNGTPAKGHDMAFVPDRAALIADAKAQGFAVEVVGDRAELYLK